MGFMMKITKSYLVKLIKECINENDNYIPKQQPYGGFVSLSKPQTKLERSYPFMSTNASKTEFFIRYMHGKFTPKMIRKLIKVYTGKSNFETESPSSGIEIIKVDGVEIARIEYGKTFCILHNAITQNSKVLMKNVFPEEYEMYVKNNS